MLETLFVPLTVSLRNSHIQVTSVKFPLFPDYRESLCPQRSDQPQIQPYGGQTPLLRYLDGSGFFIAAPAVRQQRGGVQVG